jgi:CheY-like chemotaxis protein
VPKILVADDNTNIQKMVVLAFEERGIAVTSVGNGEAAVRRIPDVNPDLVLADVFMPVRNGYEVCEFVKKDERFSHIPVILLVGAFDPLDEREARRVGADGVLKKPFVPPDPLIAMVMSALEKNPKVAAELAKAREVAAAPPEPPMPAMEIPAKSEPKPLPDFPEPTPEEAAAIYGFGKGVRTLEEAQEDSAKGPAAPAKEEESEDEFDASVTASDWRRASGDVEVPEELGGKLAFAADEDFNPVTFPSERDVPPRRIRVEELEEEIKPIVAPEADPAPAPFAAHPIERAPVAAVAESEPAAPAVVAASDVAAAPDVTATSNVSTAPVLGSAPVVGTAQIVAAAPEPPAVEAPASHAEEKHDSGLVSKAMHWMDMMSPTPANESSNGGGWMANLLGGFRKDHEKEHEKAHENAEETVQPQAHEPAPVTEALVVAPAAPEPVSRPVAETKFEARQESAPEVLAEIPAEAQAVASEPIEPVIAEPEFKSESAPSESTWGASPRSHWSILPAQLEEPTPASPAPPAFSSAQTSDSNEIEHDGDESEPSLRDPLLVQSPAVHVEPEPLLVNEDEESVRGGGYGSPREALTPLHSFFSPAGETVVEESVAAEPSARSEFPAIEPAPSEAAAEFDGRIPTVPPPNREAISSIPFLNPPAASGEESHGEAASSGISSEDGKVDELVKRVLERLEPQLHQLLSQKVLKPLVEDMIQSDVAKKEK